MEIWDKRRRNLKALIATKDTTATQLARDAGLSINTLRKFLTGETKMMQWSTIEAICKALELPTPQILDADNPFSSAKSELYERIFEMSDQDAESLLERLADKT